MRTLLRSLWGAVLAAAVVAVAPAAATAAPADRDAAVAAWQAVEQDQQVPAGWTGSVDGCVIGEESSDSLAATLRTVNALRDFAGIPPVTFDAGFNHRALAAALMMRAKNALSHDPGPDWPCYSDDGQDGAEHSNLFLGVSGAAAMVGYVDDSGVESLGHRNWVLDPHLTVMGSGSTGATNALYVVSNTPRATVAADHLTPWPPAGFVPWTWIFDDWSVEVGGDGQSVTFQDPKVTVSSDGQALDVRDVRVLGEQLAWRVDGDERLTGADHVLHVTVSGASAGGRSLPIEYDVKAFSTGNTPGPPPVAAGVKFTRGPRVQRRDGRKGRIRAGTRVRAIAEVLGGRVIAYQWLRGGRKIKGAVKSGYRVRGADRGKRLSVRVHAVSTDGSKVIKRTSKSVRVAK
jgi:uncharacterized protein YkwD